MAKLKTKKKFKFDRNTAIIVGNIVSACVLLFCCCFFFFENVELFYHDVKSYMFFSPLIIFCGVCFVCFYIMALCLSIESKTQHIVDRFDIWYRLIFSVTLLTIILRSFFGDFMAEATETYAPQLLNIDPISCIAFLSGIITWSLPRIRDNDNSEF